MFFSGKTFFLFYMFRNTFERNESHSLENYLVQILVLESEYATKSESGNGKKKLDPNRKKINSYPQHCPRSVLQGVLQGCPQGFLQGLLRGVLQGGHPPHFLAKTLFTAFYFLTRPPLLKISPTRRVP
jgi:hypothetical protein